MSRLTGQEWLWLGEKTQVNWSTFPNHDLDKQLGLIHIETLTRNHLWEWGDETD
jgi:hypothetical protein